VLLRYSSRLMAEVRSECRSLYNTFHGPFCRVYVPPRPVLCSSILLAKLSVCPM
jgi:hypothetical protein